MLPSAALTVVSLVVLALMITATRAFLQRKDLAQDLAMVKELDEGEELLRQIQDDTELFQRAYLDTFRSDSKITTSELFVIKGRVTDNLNTALRRMANDSDAEQALLEQMRGMEDDMGDKLCDVTERRGQGYWFGPLDSYFHRKVQRGKLDVFGLGKSPVVTQEQHDRMALPRLQTDHFEYKLKSA